MRPGFLISVALLFVLSTVAFSLPRMVHPPINVQLQTNVKKTFEEEILMYINRYRESKALVPLQMNPFISLEAEKHSEEMADKRMTFGHDGFQERVRNIIQKIGTLHASAENVAFGQLTAEEVVGLWIKSPGHRKNIEGNYTMTGIGTARAKDGSIYFTQIFSTK